MKPEGLKHAFSGMTIVIFNEFGIIADTSHHAYDQTTKTRIFGHTVDCAKFGSQVGSCSIFKDIFIHWTVPHLFLLYESDRFQSSSQCFRQSAYRIVCLLTWTTCVCCNRVRQIWKYFQRKWRMNISMDGLRRYRPLLISLKYCLRRTASQKVVLWRTTSDAGRKYLVMKQTREQRSARIFLKALPQNQFGNNSLS